MFAAGLLAVFLMSGTASVAEAQMCAMEQMGTQGVPSSQSSGQQPMMGRGMMGQGMCPMCMMQSTAARTGEPTDPMGMMGIMGMMGMKEDSAMDAKTRGQLLQMRGEMLKAMGEVMLKHAQALGQNQ
jgi:hypothetical protein